LFRFSRLRATPSAPSLRPCFSFRGPAAFFGAFQRTRRLNADQDFSKPLARSGSAFGTFCVHALTVIETQ